MNATTNPAAKMFSVYSLYAGQNQPTWIGTYAAFPVTSALETGRPEPVINTNGLAEIE